MRTSKSCTNERPGISRAFAFALGAIVAAVSWFPGAAAGAPSGSSGIHLTWNDCWPSAAATDTTTFPCDVNAGARDLVVGFMLDQPWDGVIGLEAVLDLQHEDPALPDWWRFETGGCRAGLATVSVDFGAVTECTNAWGSVGFGLVQQYLPGEPRGGANQARMLLVAFVSPSDSARSLAAGIAYYGLTVKLPYDRTTGFNPCTGCNKAACLVLNSVEILTLPAGSGSLFIATPGVPLGNQVMWQGTAASCAAVPISRRTWGQVKGMYR